MNRKTVSLSMGKVDLLLDPGIHKLKIIQMKKIGRILAKFLRKRGLQGSFRCDIERLVKASEHTPPISVSGYGGASVSLRIKSGDNGSCYKVWLFKPKDVNIEDFYAKLKNN